MTRESMKPFPPDRPTTLNRLLAYGCEQYARPNMLNGKKDGRWYSIPSAEVALYVKRRCLGLYSLGVRPGDHVGLLADNSPDWVMCDYAILGCGAATVPLYVTQIPEQIEYILRDANVKVLLVSSRALLERVKPFFDKLELTHVIAFFPKESGERLLTLEELEARGKRLYDSKPDLYDDLRKSTHPESIATLIYTSGTTGVPKGVLLTHDNLVSNAIDSASIQRWETKQDVALSFLPLSHIFERTIINIYIYAGVPAYFAQSIETLGEDIKTIRPTMMATVPRMLEKVFDKIMTKGSELDGFKRTLFFWAVNLAKRADPQKKGSILYRLQMAVASKLVFSKWREAVGGRLRYFIAGSAPLNVEMARVYFGAGIPIMQGYGLTETSPVISVTTPENNRIGSTGRTIPNVEVRIAEDGEIIVRGPNVMKEFYNNPEATKEVLENGWFKTGDVGYVDSDGNVFITDRKKDLIKKSSGKFIAPGPIESHLRASRYIDHAAVLGEGRKFAIAAIFPNFINLEAYAKSKSLPYSSHAELVRLPEIQLLYSTEIAETNKLVNQWERIVKFIVSDHELSIEEGLLTPTMKLRRKIIENQIKETVDALYRRYENLDENAIEHVEPFIFTNGGNEKSAGEKAASGTPTK